MHGVRKKKEMSKKRKCIYSSCQPQKFGFFLLGTFFIFFERERERERERDISNHGEEERKEKMSNSKVNKIAKKMVGT